MVFYLCKKVEDNTMIKMIQNLHTHTVLCDGRDTPEEMIEEAIARGFSSLGFSSHANTCFADTCELLGKTDDYIAEINRMKAKYEGKLKIFLGLELDRYSEGYIPNYPFDYKIASTHYAVYNGEKICYDISLDHSRDVVRRLLDGDIMMYARLYYETLADMPNHIEGDFVGHFDILTKFEELAPELFDTGSPIYRKMALEALHAVREKFEFFEVNAGTLGRGYRTYPYPAPFILDEMKKIGCKLLITTDCHNKNHLTTGFSESVELVRAHGFTEIYELSDGGFVGRKI